MTSQSTPKTIYLWSLPRSLSTAFLRAMSTLENCKGFHEPYISAFYMQKPIPEDFKQLIRSATYEEIRDELQQGKYPGCELVFIKEMAKHLVGKLQDRSFIPETATHTFLIRHPIKTIQSFISTGTKAIKEMVPDETKQEEVMSAFFLDVEQLRGEQSYEFLITLHEFITQEYKQKSIIIDADDLQTNPEGTLRAYCQEVGIEYQDSLVNWGPITPKQKEIWAFELSYPPLMHFVAGAVNGTGFVKGKPREAKVEDLEEPFRSFAQDNIPLYEKLRSLRLKPVE